MTKKTTVRKTLAAPRARAAVKVTAAQERKQVMSYLERHPDFFARDTRGTRQLLKKIRLTHPTSGKEISLMAYQNQVWREEADYAKKCFDEVAEIVRHDRKLQGLVHISFCTLLCAQDLADFCKLLNELLRARFQVNVSRLILFGRVPQKPYYQRKDLGRAPKNIKELLAKQEPSIVPEQGDISDYFFNTLLGDLTSFLILPLHYGKTNIGALCLADANAQRFIPDMPSTLMDFFADIIAAELYRHLREK